MHCWAAVSGDVFADIRAGGMGCCKGRGGLQPHAHKGEMWCLYMMSPACILQSLSHRCNQNLAVVHVSK